MTMLFVRRSSHSQIPFTRGKLPYSSSVSMIKPAISLALPILTSCNRRVGDAGEDCYPTIRPTMTALPLEEKWVVAVEVGYSGDKPHFAGPAYVRSGSRSVKASAELYRDLLTSHCTLAGELLKCKGKRVTVRVVNKKLGNRYPEWDPSINREYDCTIVSCDPFSVTFDLHGYNESCTESLEGIKLDWDSLHQRRMVIVRGTPPLSPRG